VGLRGALGAGVVGTVCRASSVFPDSQGNANFKAKQEFNGELVWIKQKEGKTEAHKIGKSTKGRDVLQP
jgi:hypothetical protein